MRGCAKYSPRNVAVFASREAPDRLIRTVESILAASPEAVRVDVLINGNPRAARELGACVKNFDTFTCLRVLNVWSIPVADKAHAWNQYLYQVWPAEGGCFNVDGYVQVLPGAFSKLEADLVAAPLAFAATGVPRVGHSSALLAEQMLKQGGLHGNFFLLSESAMGSLQSQQFRLPLGLYRTDSTLGAVLAVGLNPSTEKWSLRQRVIVDPSVSWSVEERPWWQPGEVKLQFRRRLRQAQGDLENLAIRHLLRRRRLPFDQWPRTIAEVVDLWSLECPADFRQAIRWNFLVRRALEGLRQPRNWSGADAPPELVASASGSQADSSW